MDKYKVILNERAYRDLEDIFEYISKNLQSPENARGQTDRIGEALRKLSVFPQSHQERMVGAFVGKGYRQLLIDNYIAIFRIDETTKTVTIVTIQYHGRNM